MASVVVISILAIHPTFASNDDAYSYDGYAKSSSCTSCVDLSNINYNAFINRLSTQVTSISRSLANLTRAVSEGITTVKGSVKNRTKG